MSPQRIVGTFLLDSLVALLLYATAIVASGAIADLLPAAYSWLHLAVFYLAVSPVALYARWRGHISFFTSDVLVFLPAPLLIGRFSGLLDVNMFTMFTLPFAITCVGWGLFKFRQWIHKSLGRSRRTNRERG
jgi:hypothetical protein